MVVKVKFQGQISRNNNKSNISESKLDVFSISKYFGFRNQFIQWGIQKCLVEFFPRSSKVISRSLFKTLQRHYSKFWEYIKSWPNHKNVGIPTHCWLRNLFGILSAMSYVIYGGQGQISRNNNKSTINESKLDDISIPNYFGLRNQII